MASSVVWDKVDDQGGGGGGAGAAAGAGGAGAGAAAGGAAGDGGAAAAGGAGGGAAAGGAAGAGTGAATWPNNWRSLVTTDDKVLKRLERYTSPKAVADALIAAQNKISSGELKSNTPFPEKGTEEEKTAWRTENGVPQKSEEYSFEGVKIEDVDKPFIAEFAKEAHALHMSPTHAKGAVAAYLKLRDKLVADFDAKDTQTRKETEDALRSEWGPDYRKNVNMIQGLLDTAPEGLKARLASQRDPNGISFGNDPDAMRWLADLARQINPVATVVGGDSANQASAIEDEITKIEKTMKENRKAYNADAKMQTRYQELLGARARLSEKKKK